MPLKVHAPRVGDFAPDGPLIAHGRETSLRELRDGRALLLVFLRHLM